MPRERDAAQVGGNKIDETASQRSQVENCSTRKLVTEHVSTILTVLSRDNRRLWNHREPFH